MILRKGMWVNYKGKVGILVPEGRALTVHLVDASGVTIEVVNGVPEVDADGETFLRPLTAGDVAQAAYNDIPAPRRPAEAIAQRLGYL